MSFFNLKRTAQLLSVVLALMPVLDVSAMARPVVMQPMLASQLTNTQADNLIESAKDATDFADSMPSLLQAAGLTTGTTLYTTLLYQFNASNSSYKNAAMNNSAIVSLYTAYATAANAALAVGATAGQINAAMQALVTFMTALFPRLVQALGAVSSFTLPWTKVKIAARAAGDTSANQSIVNNLVSELAALVYAYGQATNNNTLAGVQNNINTLVAATNAINTAVSTATTQINGYVTTYNNQITNALTAATITTTFATALTNINGAYPSVLTVVTQNNNQAGLIKVINSGIAAISATVAPTQLATAKSSFATAQTNFNAALTAAQAAFPSTLPVDTTTTPAVGSLTVATAANFSTSVPGTAILGLNTTATTVATSPTILASTLTSAVATATATITTDKNTAVTNITNATDVVSVNNAKNAGIKQINNDYVAITAAGSAFSAALDAAVAKENGLSTPNSTLSAAITAAQTAFPEAVGQNGGIVFAITSGASNYPTSVPGIAITAIYNAAYNAPAATNPTTLTSNLSAALTTATATITADQTAGTTAINAPNANKQTALSNAITQINSDYTTIVSAGSNLMVALNYAQQLQTTLGTKTPATLATQITTAQTAFPVASPAIVFAVTNGAVNYPTSVPGLAITALNNIVNPGTPSSGACSGSNLGACIGGIIGGVMALLLGGLALGLWKTGKWPFSESDVDTVKDLANDYDPANAVKDQQAIENENPAEVASDSAAKCVDAYNKAVGTDFTDPASLKTFNEMIGGTAQGSFPADLARPYLQKMSAIQTAEGVNVSQDTLLEMAKPGSSILPKDFTGTQLDALDLITRIAEAYPSSVNDVVSPTDFQNKIANLESMPGGSSGLYPGQGGGAGTVIPGKGPGTGGAGTVPTEGQSTAFNDLATATGDMAANMQSFIKANSVTKAQFDQLVDSLEIKAEADPSDADLQRQLEEAKAIQEAADTTSPDYNPAEDPFAGE